MLKCSWACDEHLQHLAWHPLLHGECDKCCKVLSAVSSQTWVQVHLHACYFLHSAEIHPSELSQKNSSNPTMNENKAQMTAENISVGFIQPWNVFKALKTASLNQTQWRQGSWHARKQAFDDTRWRNIPHLLWSHCSHSFHLAFKSSSLPFPHCRTRWLLSNGHGLFYHNFLWLDSSGRLLFGLFLPLKWHSRLNYLMLLLNRTWEQSFSYKCIIFEPLPLWQTDSISKVSQFVNHKSLQHAIQHGTKWYLACTDWAGQKLPYSEAIEYNWGCQVNKWGFVFPAAEEQNYMQYILFTQGNNRIV